MPVIASPNVAREVAGFLNDGRQLDHEIRNLSFRVRQVLTEPGCVVLGASLQPNVPLFSVLTPLADCFARREERVVIVDFTFSEGDVSRESMSALMPRSRRDSQLPRNSGFGQAGVGEYLLAETDLDQVIYPTSIEHVDCIPGGYAGVPQDVETSRRMDAMMRSLRHRYSIILIAGPDQVQSAALETLISRADGVLVVATPSADRAFPEAHRFVERLARLQAPFLGAALVTYATPTRAVVVRHAKGKAKWKEAPGHSVCQTPIQP